MTKLRVYKSKIEYGFLLAFFLLVILVIFGLIIKKESMSSILINGGIIIAIFVFLCYGIFSIRYFIDGETLKIRNGFIYRKDIEISNIKSIKKSNSIISSPAAVFDKIEINYNKYDSVLVSPNDKESFANDLLAINPSIKLQLK
jgi:hypothetical protein